MASAGLGSQAIEHLTAAVLVQPELRRGAGGPWRTRCGGRAASAESLARYQEALRTNPRASEARFGYGMALVRLRRYHEARAWFEEAAASRPDALDLQHALARVLVAAPDDEARDGARGLGLVQQVRGSCADRARLPTIRSRWPLTRRFRWRWPRPVTSARPPSSSAT